MRREEGGHPAGSRETPRSEVGEVKEEPDMGQAGTAGR